MSPILKDQTQFDTNYRKGVPEGKVSLAFRLVFQRSDRTLTDAEVSKATGKGRHVTTAATLYELPSGGHVVDTPGFREYGVHNVDRHELGRYYVEFRPHLAKCRFTDCLHVREPECGVLEALGRGEISAQRYRNYTQILQSLP